MALLDDLRGALAAEVDDYFTDETLLSYLNKAKARVLSTLITIEDGRDKPLRALDRLKTEVPLSTVGATVTEPETGLFTFDLTVDLSAVEKVDYLEYKTTPIREIRNKDLIELRNSNIFPSNTESYYSVKFDDPNIVFTFYLFETPDESIDVYVINKVSTITNLTEELGDLPERFTNAVINSAAALAVMQEGIKDELANPAFFEQIYDKELQTAIY